FACCLNKVRSGFPRLHEHWMPAGACPERSRRAGMTSFPPKRESRTLRRRNDAHAYSGLHLYEEAVLGFPLPLRERDRVRGKAVATQLLIQTKSAVRREFYEISNRQRR